MPGLKLAKKSQALKSSHHLVDDPMNDGLVDPLQDAEISANGPSFGYGLSQAALDMGQVPKHKPVPVSLIDDDDDGPKVDLDLDDDLVDDDVDDDLDDEEVASLEMSVVQLQEQLDLSDDPDMAAAQVEQMISEEEEDLLEEDLDDELLLDSDLDDDLLSDGASDGDGLVEPPDDQLPMILEDEEMDFEEPQLQDDESLLQSPQHDDGLLDPPLQDPLASSGVSKAWAPPSAIQAQGLQSELDTALTDPSMKDAVSEQNPPLWDKLKGAVNLKNAARATPLVGPALNATRTRHEHRKGKAMENLQKGQGKNTLLQSLAKTTGSHAKVKRNAAAVSTGFSLGTSAASFTGVGLATGMLGDLAANAASSSVSSWGGVAINMGTEKAADVLQSLAVKGGSKLASEKYYKPKLPSIARSKVSSAKGSQGNLKGYRNARALLYQLGMGERDDDTLADQGATPKQEQARLALKERLGGAPDQDLHARQQRKIPRKVLKDKADWLTEEERATYDKLKKGEIDGSAVPPEMLLPILWEANKLFDFHQKVMAKKQKAAK